MATSSSRRKQDPYLGKTVAGRYRLEARLGEGGMGVVYRARHVLIDRVVALKLIRPDLRGETHLRAWMLREARAANRVDHAHIVQIHDVGETDDGELYLVMEYLVGTSLSAECTKGSMPIDRAADIIEQMCAALARAHDLGVVHRDLKSDNIMLTVQGGRRDFVKILDFGLAALTRDARLAPKGAVFGTPEYMAPEQARGEDATASCDLYALGILFFEMLTGQLPFRSNDRETLLEMQRKAPAPRPSKIRGEIPPQCEAIIMRLLEKDPAKRFRDGHHLQEELKAFQRSLPSKLLESSPSEAPMAPPPPPPAPTPGVQEWGTRAANFQRILARAYPNGKSPNELHDAAAKLWELASRAARLEGEVASQSRKLDATERRGRALRAELGRKVEDLATDESRSLREAADWHERADTLAQAVRNSSTELEAIKKQVAELERDKAPDVALVKERFQALGAAQATIEVNHRQAEANLAQAERCEARAAELRKQIEDLRGQLQRYSDALENDLSAGRERMAGKVKDAVEFEKAFGQASAILVVGLRDRPECRDLIEELVASDRQSRGLHERRAQSRRASNRATDPTPQRQSNTG
ncbi:MAG: protein kinase [Myxococcales bacterium]|nr:protein kinase [Myxococcales bacterium]